MTGEGVRVTFGVRDLAVARGRHEVLQSVSFDVPSGCTVLMGPNGAGKTTACRAVLGDLPIRAGRVVQNGTPISSKADWRRFRADLGWLPQSFGAPSRASVGGILRYAGWLKHCEVDVDRILGWVGLEGVGRRRFGQLSGGQMRRIGIACALVGEPSGLLLDEPTVGLDPEQRDDFHGLVRTVAATASVLISTHLLEDVAAMADHVLILDQGRVQFEGSTQELAGRATPTVDDLRSGYLRAVA